MKRLFPKGPGAFLGLIVITILFGTMVNGCAVFQDACAECRQNPCKSPSYCTRLTQQRDDGVRNQLRALNNDGGPLKANLRGIVPLSSPGVFSWSACGVEYKGHQAVIAYWPANQPRNFCDASRETRPYPELWFKFNYEQDIGASTQPDVRMKEVEIYFINVDTGKEVGPIWIPAENYNTPYGDVQRVALGYDCPKGNKVCHCERDVPSVYDYILSDNWRVEVEIVICVDGEDHKVDLSDEMFGLVQAEDGSESYNDQFLFFNHAGSDHWLRPKSWGFNSDGTACLHRWATRDELQTKRLIIENRPKYSMLPGDCANCRLEEATREAAEDSDSDNHQETE